MSFYPTLNLRSGSTIPPLRFFIPLLLYRGDRRLGPKAQDFYATFGLGQDDRYISTVDADGVALAFIKGFYQLLQVKDAQIAAQGYHIAALQSESIAQRERLAALEARLMELEERF